MAHKVTEATEVTEVTEATEVTQCHGGADNTKTDGGVAYSFLDNFRCKYFEQNVSNRTGKQSPSLNAPTVPP